MKRYKASAVLRVLSLGIFQHAVSIKNGVLRTTCGFLFRIKPIKIENITYIQCYAKRVWAKGGYVDETYYKFVVKGEEHRLLRFYVLDAKEMQQLLKDIRQLNPKVEYSVEIKAFMNTYIKPYKIHFDFKPIDQKTNEEREAKVSLEFRLQHPSKEVAHLWLTLLLGAIPFFVIMPFWIWWGQIFKGVSIWISSVFITLSIVAFSIVMFHLGMALYGLYEGKQKLLKYVYIGGFCWFFALFLELLIYFF